jgi:predicted RNase H-like nuclease (RuvC/YqgF family)
MIDTLVLAVAGLALTFTLLSLRRAQEKVAGLESDIDAVENHNRMLVEQRDTVKATLAETAASLEATKKSLEATEKEKQEVERQRATLAETAARLEKVRAELESDLGRLRREHESLEFRVVEFQGQWSHQLTTLDAEISTLIRQIGEFRKGTQLPIVRGEPSSAGAGAEPAAAAMALGPRLAGALPRPLSAESPALPAEAAASPVRRVP